MIAKETRALFERSLYSKVNNCPVLSLTHFLKNSLLKKRPKKGLKDICWFAALHSGLLHNYGTSIIKSKISSNNLSNEKLKTGVFRDDISKTVYFSVLTESPVHIEDFTRARVNESDLTAVLVETGAMPVLTKSRNPTACAWGGSIHSYLTHS